MVSGIAELWGLLLFGSKIEGLNVGDTLNNLWALVLSVFNGWGGNPSSVTFGEQDLCVVLSLVCCISLFFLLFRFIYGIFVFWGRGR